MTRGYIFISEDEYEIRDITAFELIQARSEGRELFEETGGEDFEKNLIQQACMVSKGLFLRGEQAFENGRAVLEKLTAEEIESAAVQYQYEVSPPADDDSGTLLPESRKSTVWDENRKDMLKTAVYESGADEMNTQSGAYEQIIREILKSQVKYENGNTEDRIRGVNKQQGSLRRI